MPRRNATGVHICLARQFVDETFNGKDIVIRSNAAPEAGDHAWRLGAHILDVFVRDVVGHVDRAIDGVDVDALLESRRQPTREIDEPVTLYFQALIFPFDRDAEIVSR